VIGTRDRGFANGVSGRLSNKSVGRSSAEDIFELMN